MWKSHIFCDVRALQGAEGVIVKLIGATVHALEYVRQGRAGYRLTAVFLPLASLQAFQLEKLPRDDKNKHMHLT